MLPNVVQSNPDPRVDSPLRLCPLSMLRNIVARTTRKHLHRPLATMADLPPSHPLTQQPPDDGLADVTHPRRNCEPSEPAQRLAVDLG